MTDNIFGELHAKLNWRGQIEAAKVNRCLIFSEDQSQCSDLTHEIYMSPKITRLFLEVSPGGCLPQKKPNCKMQCKVHPESQVFQKQSIEIVLSSALMRVWADAEFNN